MNITVKSVWPEWEITELIGEGSYGKVYKAIKSDHNIKSQSAIKIIPVPQSNSEIKTLRAEGMTNKQSKTYLKRAVDSVINEIETMISLNSAPNIVSIHDYKVIEKKEEIGWEVHIRMEFLERFEEYIIDRKMSEKEVIKFGVDICSALELCAKHDPPIIHRDIKPENLFINQFGIYKLGDFGTARELEKTKGPYSQAGTYNYMAPEIKNGDDYGVQVDIYSLGIVLYRLLNNSRLPFCDPHKQLEYGERIEALNKRFNGETLPKPIDASEPMTHLILKACAFNQEDRFQSATLLKEALEKVLNGEYIILKEEKNTTFQVHRDNETTKNETKLLKQKLETSSKKKSKAPLIIIFLILLIGVVGGGYFVFNKFTDPIEAFEQYIDQDEYSEADSVLKNKIIDDDKKLDEADKILKDKAEAIIDKYVNEVKSYDETITALDGIKSLNIIDDTEMETFYDNINSLRISKTAYESAEEHLKNNDYENAIVELRKVKEKDENYSNAQEQLTNIILNYKESIFAQISDYESKNAFADAISLLNKAQSLIPNDVDLESKLEKIFEKQIKEIKENSEKTKDYSNGIDNLKALQIEDPDNEDLKSAIDDLQVSHVNYIIVQADNLANDKKFEEAVRLLSDNKDLYSAHSSDFQKKIDEFTKRLPVSLYGIDWLTLKYGAVGGWSKYEYVDNLKDSTGVVYDKAAYCQVATSNRTNLDSNSITVEYFLDKKYSTFSGDLVIPFETRSKDDTFNVYFFIDDQQIYQSPSISLGSLPESFNVDVSNAIKLKIKIVRIEANNSESAIAIVNAKLGN